MKTREQFADALHHLLGEKQLKKLTMSRPDDKTILRSEGHLFEKKGVCHLQIETFHTDGKATHVNYPLQTEAEIDACVDALLASMKDPEADRGNDEDGNPVNYYEDVKENIIYTKKYEEFNQEVIAKMATLKVEINQKAVKACDPREFRNAIFGE